MLMTAMIVAHPHGAHAQAVHPQDKPTWILRSGRSLTLFPGGDIYPVYVADPHRPTNVIEETFIVGGALPGTESPLTHLGAGGRFGVIRIDPARPDGWSWQVSIEAGLDALFDSQNRLDVVGWDGNYGLTVTTAASSPIALKFGVLHLSAHLGDEYQERVGRQRINYTREEVTIGAAWQWASRGRAYADSGFAYRLGDGSLEPWRVQWGLEYEGQADSRIGRFAAGDFSSMQERNWKVDATVELGLVLRGDGRTSRLLLQWHHGRPTASEFFEYSVSSVNVALRIDL
jgi:hypothetical protein